MDLSQAVKNQALTELQNSVGWKIIVEEVNILISQLQEQLDALTMDTTVEDMWKWKVAKNRLQFLLDLPELLKESTKKPKSMLVDGTYA